MAALFYLIDTVFSVVNTLLLVYVVLSVLISFEIVNTRNRLVFTVYDGLRRLFEPLLAKIRRILPDTGQLDLSPIVLFIAIGFVRYLLISLLSF